jgi:hypothetical protein
MGIAPRRFTVSGPSRVPNSNLTINRVSGYHLNQTSQLADLTAHADLTICLYDRQSCRVVTPVF